MERHTELAINLKAYPFQERDKIVVFLTENQGKVTGLAKGGIGSKRFGGSLDFLACSNIHYIQKPNSDMVRIEEATSRHEFRNLHADFLRLTAASFAAEFCLKLIENNAPNRELFVLMSNFLYQLDGGRSVPQSVAAFLCKAFRLMGYPPSLLRCVTCSTAAHEVSTAFWNSEAGGMICSDCASKERATERIELEGELLLYFSILTMKPYKELPEPVGKMDMKLFRILSDFLHHHIPGLPKDGLNSWKMLSGSL